MDMSLCFICGEDAFIGHQCPPGISPGIYASPSFIAKAKALKQARDVRIWPRDIPCVSAPASTVLSFDEALDRAHARLLDLIEHPEKIDAIEDGATFSTSRLSDEEMASLARQVRLRQGGSDG